MLFFSETSSDLIIPTPQTQTPAPDSDGSADSELQVGRYFIGVHAYCCSATGFSLETFLR